MRAQSLSLPSIAGVFVRRCLAPLGVLVVMMGAVAAVDLPRVLYVYGDVAADGAIPSGSQDAFHQMRLNDTGDRGMTQFRDAIIEAGFAIEERYDAATTLTASLLANYKVLILGSNQKRFSAAEASAVNTWVNGGGGLIAYSDSAFGGAYQQVGIGNTKGRDSDNDLTVQFGMFFMRDNGAGNYLVNQYEFDHFINGQNKNGGLGYRGEGVSSVRVSAPAVVLAKLQNGGLGGGIRLHNDDPAYNAAIDAALAIANIGSGRVLGTFDRNTFWNAGEGTRLSHVDNRLFVQRMVLWAAGLDGTPPPTNNPPSVNLSGPVNGATYTAPATVTMTATASDSDGTVTKVEFFAGSNKVGEDTTSPYGFSWTNVAAGSYSLTARAIDDDGAPTTSSAVTITVASTPTTQAPYGGTPWAIPGRVQTENYDLGGASVAYNDTTAGNNGSSHRSEDVDIQSTSDTGGGFNVGWIATGEWLEYTVQVGSAGMYTLQTRVAAPSAGGQFRITHLGVDKTGPVVVPATGGWQTWSTISTSGVSLPAGTVVLRLEVVSGSWNVNWFELQAVTGNTAPVVAAGSDQTITLPATASLSGSASDDGQPTNALTSTWTQISGPGVTTFANGSAVATTASFTVAGVYVLRLTASDGALSSSDDVTITVQTAPVSGLPAPWGAQDIGSVLPAGSASLAAGIFTVRGSGSDIWNAADAFHYVSQPVTGDVTITARVTGIDNTDAWAKAGVMIRETLTASSQQAMMVITPGNGASFQRRATTGGTTSHTTSNGINSPHWVRVVRSGNTVTGYRSTDGTTWVQVGTQSISMGAAVHVGLAVTSHNNGTLCTATFDSVSVTTQEPPEPGGLAVAINAGGGASGDYAADAQVSGGQTYATSATIDTVNVIDPAPQAVYRTERYGNFTYTIGNLTPAASYTLRLHFAEVYHTSAGKRVFHVAVNGGAQLSNFDIYATAGATNRAVVREFTVTANGSGQLVVEFMNIIDNAKLSGLEVIDVLPTANG